MRRVIIRRTSFLLGILAIFGVVATAFIWARSPDAQFLWDTRRLMKLKIVVDADGRCTARDLLTPLYVGLEDVPEHLREALVYREDQRFLQHLGIDIQSYGRVLLEAVKGNGLQGGSTLTQQLARVLTLDNRPSLQRKYFEAIVALKLEWSLTKDQILELYLNHAYFGNGVFGVGAAARFYFGKSASELTPLESCILISSLPAPARYNFKANPELALERARRFMMKSCDANIFTLAEISVALVEAPRKGNLSLNRPETRWFWYSVQNELASVAERGPGSYTVFSTLDPELQIYADSAVREALRGYSGIESALVSLTPSGEIKAIVGGRDYNRRMFNHAVASDRQPGSAFKPIIYLAALQSGLDPDSELIDMPNKQGWPKNAHGYAGRLMFKHALTNSPNAAAVLLLERIGYQPVTELASQLGIESKLTAQPSLALGCSEVSLLELTGAYAAISNGGVQAPPHGVLSIVDDKALLVSNFDVRTKRVVDAQHVTTLKSMLHEVVAQGTGRNAQLENVVVYGKTGTTDGNRDAWFMGFTEQLTTGVWVGRPDGLGMPGISGSNLPVSAWRRYMKTSYRFVDLSSVQCQAPMHHGLLSTLGIGTGLATTR